MKNRYLFPFLTCLSLLLLNSCTEDELPTVGGTGFITLLEASSFILMVEENVAEGTVLGSVSARTNGGPITYTLDSQEPAGAIALDAATGAITVVDASAFDFEVNERITGNFNVRSDDQTETGTITLTIVDVDDTDREIWTGETMTFAKEGGADPNEESNQDRITDNVWLTRGNDGGQIYNAVAETAANKGNSPVDTEWAIGTVDNISSLEFKQFRETLGKPKDAIGMDLVLHLLTDDVYLSFKIISWDQEKVGGLSYERSTK